MKKILLCLFLILLSNKLTADDLGGIGFICKNFSSYDYLEKDKRYKEQAKKKGEKGEIVIPKSVYDSILGGMTYTKENIYIGVHVYDNETVSIFVLNLDKEHGVKEKLANYLTEPSNFFVLNNDKLYFSINRINLEITFFKKGMEVLNLSQGDENSFADCELYKESSYELIRILIDTKWLEYKERVKKSAQF